ncbi:hypothetical protein BT69DRAFT_1307084 [Atractiella rhizophila]|nr:hypothetical protein BT69DRAFT_1307084 [Atractiella rhizophila]
MSEMKQQLADMSVQWKCRAMTKIQIRLSRLHCRVPRTLQRLQGRENVPSPITVVPSPPALAPSLSPSKAPETLAPPPQELPKLEAPAPLPSFAPPVTTETDEESDEVGGDGIDTTDDEAETHLTSPPVSSDQTTPKVATFEPPLSTPRAPSSLSPRHHSPSPVPAKPEPNHGADHTGSSSARLQAVITRTIWSLAMIGGFIMLLLLGHGWMIMLVFFVQTAVYRELTNLFGKAYDGNGKDNGSGVVDEKRVLRREEKRKESDRWGRATSWYFFGVANYFFYGESIIKYFKHIVLVDAYLLPFAQHHRFISLILYVIGFVSFVGSLKRGQLRRQFGLFCWIHMTLLYIGLIWFWVPASLVIMNDISAYGFVGAFFATVVFSYFWATFFMRFNYLICSVRDFSQTAFSDVHCQPNPVFLWHEFPLPDNLASFASYILRREVKNFVWAPFQVHAIVLAIFASLVAPFGGFFASGFKRAFNIKDFGDSIPGHGGLTDRMDCQFLMGLFSYVYYSSLVRVQYVSVGSVLGTIINGLSTEDQLELYHDLQKYLKGQGIAY